MKIINEESKGESVSSAPYLFKCISLFGFVPGTAYLKLLTSPPCPTAPLVASMTTLTFLSYAGSTASPDPARQDPMSTPSGPTKVSLLPSLCKWPPTPIPAMFCWGKNPTTQGCGTVCEQKLILLPWRAMVLQKPAGNPSCLQQEARTVLFLSRTEPVGSRQSTLSHPPCSGRWGLVRKH